MYHFILLSSLTFLVIDLTSDVWLVTFYCFCSLFGQETQETLQDALCGVVGSLPRSNLDKCTEFFTIKAMREGHHAVATDHQVMCCRLNI